jgi:hypothetical protein
LPPTQIVLHVYLIHQKFLFLTSGQFSNPSLQKFSITCLLISVAIETFGGLTAFCQRICKLAPLREPMGIKECFILFAIVNFVGHNSVPEFPQDENYSVSIIFRSMIWVGGGACFVSQVTRHRRLRIHILLRLQFRP